MIRKTSKRKSISIMIWGVPVALIYSILVNFTAIYVSSINLYISPLASFFALLIVTVFQLAYLPLRKTFSGNILLEICYATAPSLILLLLVFAQYKFVWALLLLLSTVFISILLCRRVLSEDKQLSFHQKKNVVLRISSLIVCAVLLIPGILSVCCYKLESPYYEAVELYKEILLELSGGAEEPEKRLSKQEMVQQLPELKKLNEWDTLSNQSRLNLLQMVADIEAYDLRISTVPVESAKFISYYTLASYDSERKVITIDLQHVNIDSSFECVQSIIHEMRHHMQHQVIESVDFSNENSNSRYFDQVRKWREEFICYESGNNGTEEDYQAYASQSCEEDAREYSSEQASLLFMWLDIPVEKESIIREENYNGNRLNREKNHFRKRSNNLNTEDSAYVA